MDILVQIGSKIDSFDRFSKSMPQILLTFGFENDIVSLIMHVKFRVDTMSGSWVIARAYINYSNLRLVISWEATDCPAWSVHLRSKDWFISFLRFFAWSCTSIKQNDWQSRIFKKKSGGRDLGTKVVKKGLFLNFLKKLSLDFVLVWSAKGPYGPSSVCQVWSPGKIWFSRYGAKIGQKRALFEFSQEFFICIFRYCTCW